MANIGREVREFEVPEPTVIPEKQQAEPMRERERERDPLTEPVMVPSEPEPKEPWRG